MKRTLKRASKWLLLVLVLGEALLVWSGVLDLREAVREVLPAPDGPTLVAS